jgi:hypothetical protein
MLRTEVLPNGARLAQDEKTSARVWLENPTLLAWSIEGHGLMTVVKRVIADLEALCPKEGEFVVFNDTERMPTYDTGFRQALTEWSDSKRGRLKTIHILTRSKVVAMGASVSNMLLGGNIKMYASRTPFETAFVAAGGAANRFLRVA